MSGSTFRRSVNVYLSGAMSPQQQSLALARVAKDGLAELIQSGRASPSYRRYVDGKEGAPEESVKPAGIIVYRFSVLAEAAAFAMAFLIERAPAKSGQYRRGFWYAVDGTPISQASFDTQKATGAEEIILYNRLPYSRKIDVQLVGTKRLRFSVPPGLFDDAARAVRARFPTLDAKRLYTVNHPAAERAKRGQRAGRMIEYPALVLSAR